MLTVDGPILGVCKNLKLKPANLLVLSIGMSLILDLLSQVVLDFFTFWWVSERAKGLQNGDHVEDLVGLSASWQRGLDFLHSSGSLAGALLGLLASWGRDSLPCCGSR